MEGHSKSALLVGHFLNEIAEDCGNPVEPRIPSVPGTDKGSTEGGAKFQRTP